LGSTKKKNELYKLLIYINRDHGQHGRDSVIAPSTAFERLMLVVETIQTTKFQPLE